VSETKIERERARGGGCLAEGGIIGTALVRQPRPQMQQHRLSNHRFQILKIALACVRIRQVVVQIKAVEKDDLIPGQPSSCNPGEPSGGRGFSPQSGIKSSFFVPHVTGFRRAPVQINDLNTAVRSYSEGLEEGGCSAHRLPSQHPLWEGYHESRRCSRDTYP